MPFRNALLSIERVSTLSFTLLSCCSTGAEGLVVGESEFVDGISFFVNRGLSNHSQRCHFAASVLEGGLFWQGQLPASRHLLLEHGNQLCLVASGRFVVATSEVGADVGEAILLRDLAEGEFGALGDALLEARPERMRREKRGEKFGRPKFGIVRHGAERLRANGSPKVERVAAKDGEVWAAASCDHSKRNSVGWVVGWGALKMQARASARRGPGRRGKRESMFGNGIVGSGTRGANLPSLRSCTRRLVGADGARPSLGAVPALRDPGRSWCDGREAREGLLVSVAVSQAVEGERRAVRTGGAKATCGNDKSGRKGVVGAKRRLWKSRWAASQSYDHCEGLATKEDRG